MSFSRKVKDELCLAPLKPADSQGWELAAALLGAARFRSDGIRLSTSHEGTALRMVRGLQAQLGLQPDLLRGRELWTVAVTGADGQGRVLADLRDRFRFEPARGQAPADGLPDAASLSEDAGRAILRGLFLACGSLTDPLKAYHLEMSTRRSQAALLGLRLLEIHGIRVARLRRGPLQVLYAKEGQHIADFLALTGAHAALLAFEALRVEKEMRNIVNRVVNCDNANLQRLAESSVRQLERIRAFAERHDTTSLPDELRDVAELRLAHPDLSLRELGELLSPPLGKSGINHRMRRLEREIGEILETERIQAREGGPEAHAPGDRPRRA